MSDERSFDPKKHMRVFERRQRQPDGSYKTVKVDYLDVKWRLVWFRQEHPTGSITTDLLTTPGVTPAVVKATVTTDEGAVTTGYGQQGEDDWSDWLEKAETRAIGRALAAIGYGTQFCEDFEEIISDAPVERGRSSGAPNPGPKQQSNAPMTANQQKYLLSLSREAGIPSDELDEIMHERFGHGLDDLTKTEASALIGSLQELRDERAKASGEDDVPFDQRPSTQEGQSSAESGELLTENQQKFIFGLASELGMDGQEINDVASNRYGRPVGDLLKSEATELIKAMKEMQSNPAPNGESVPTDRQIGAIMSLQKRQNINDSDLMGFAAKVAGQEIDSLVELTEDQASTLIKELQAI